MLNCQVRRKSDVADLPSLQAEEQVDNGKGYA